MAEKAKYLRIKRTLQLVYLEEYTEDKYGGLTIEQARVYEEEKDDTDELMEELTLVAGNATFGHGVAIVNGPVGMLNSIVTIVER